MHDGLPSALEQQTMAMAAWHATGGLTRRDAGEWAGPPWPPAGHKAAGPGGGWEDPAAELVTVP